MQHQSVLDALDKRALRFEERGQRQKDIDQELYEEALDETGTVSTADLTESDGESTIYRTEYLEVEEVRGVDDELL